MLLHKNRPFSILITFFFVQAMVFFFSFLLFSKTVDAQSCETTMGLLRPCFGYVAATPYGGSTIPSELCCKTFQRSYHVGGAHCICRFLSKNSPISVESNRLFQLDNICGTKQSLEKLCDGGKGVRPPLAPAPLSAPPVTAPPTPPSLLWTQFFVGLYTLALSTCVVYFVARLRGKSLS